MFLTYEVEFPRQYLKLVKNVLMLKFLNSNTKFLK